MALGEERVCSGFGTMGYVGIELLKMMNGIAKRWKQLSGRDHWKNLLDPLDIDLRKYLIHYGERASSTYDTFNMEILSKYAGSSRYAKRNLFDNVGLEKGNPYKYKVVKYFYATSQIGLPDAFMLKSSAENPWSTDTNWIGYVAVATEEGKVALGRRDILIAWRGTIKLQEWQKDFDFPLVSASKLLGKACGANVHKGFLSIYTSNDPHSPYCKVSARDQVLSQVKQLVDQYKNEDISITLTGHSLGAALATLNAVDIVFNGINKSCPVTVFGYGCPQVGDIFFQNIFHSMDDLRLLRIRNAPDVVPFCPGLVGYTEVGEQLVMDSRKSNFLKFPGDISSWHNMEAGYLHTIAGTQGIIGGFHLEVKRDISLVNKMSYALNDKYLVPGFWWIEKNRGMVQMDDGSWKLDDHERDDDGGLSNTLEI
ncbi:unnamed protein product [Ilex paraguariensis]|uniref:Phospholipase A1 n=1 Tax=Ilex paraguariensis TaxID=185542 RepID=A0ABC8RI65_9AQUA